MASIYTKTGDEGMTGLFGGKRVTKFNSRIDVCGTIDEVISVIAFARSVVSCEFTCSVLKKVEKELFLVASETACPEPDKFLQSKINPSEIEWMERKIDEIMSVVTFKRDFIIPGPYASSAILHVARTTVRRAERRMVRLKFREEIRSDILKYLNRLSDLMYALAIYEEQEEVIRVIKKKVKVVIDMGNEMKSLTLDIALKICDAARKKAEEIQQPMVIAVTDQSGYLILLNRMDRALLASVEIAKDKAFTAVMFKMPTEELAKLSVPGGQLYGVNTVANGRIIVFGGGIPVFWGEEIVGAIGVSGGSVSEDISVAKAGLYAIERRI